MIWRFPESSGYPCSSSILTGCSIVNHTASSRGTPHCREPPYHVWLVVTGCHKFYFPNNIGLMSSSQLTNSYFSEGWLKTTNQMCFDSPTIGRFFDATLIPRSLENLPGGLAVGRSSQVAKTRQKPTDGGRGKWRVNG